MWTLVRHIAWSVGLGAVLLFGLGFAITTPARMPGYALVFLDADHETYLAPQCVPNWQRHATEASTPLRRSHLAVAKALGYAPDKACDATSAFHPPGPSVSRLLLQRAGWLKPPTQWWDVPYRTEDGMVYPPATHA
jgi:hypothetical protein